MQIKNGGYTLIEVLVAMGIFSIAYFAVAGMQIRALNATARGIIATEAMDLAASHAESLHAMPLYPCLDNTAIKRESRFVHPQKLAEGRREIEAGRFTVSILIDDDKPLGSVSNIYMGESGPERVTVSKSITIAVYETRKPDTVLAQIESAKFWEQDL